MSALAVTAGTSSRLSLRAGPFDVSQIAFAGGRRLRWHAHPRACVAVIVSGMVRKQFSGQAFDAGVATLVSMPAEESHEDLFGHDGASIVVAELDEGVEPVSCFSDWGALLVALRIARELARPDAFSSLAIEGLVLELSALAGRGPAPARAEPWLWQAHEILHESFRDAPSAGQIAAQVGVHPAHLARCFRAHFRESLGGCARRLRLEWAAIELVRSAVPLAQLAVEAGFVDQSHFTRAFRQQFGMTPGRYRAAHR